MTGEIEVPDLDTTTVWPRLHSRAETLLLTNPGDPVGVAGLMYDLNLLILEVAELALVANSDRYAAETTYKRVFNTALDKHAATVSLVAFAKAKAELDALEAKEAWDYQRALYHHIEDVQKALQTKHFGLMNINKNIQSALFDGGRRQ